MAYTVNYTDNTKIAITLGNGTVDNSTNIGLIGQGYAGYGEIVAEDLLHLLEHFAGAVAPTKPVEGQLWYDSANNIVKYFDSTAANGGNWKFIASMTSQIAAPTGVGEQVGHFWFDTSTDNLYIYGSTGWQLITSAGNTRISTQTRYDTGNTLHDTIETYVNGVIVSITSSTAVTWSPAIAGVHTEYLLDGVTLLNTQFPVIKQGITLNNGASYVFSGTATAALYADLAERYAADQPMLPGTVVLLGGVKEVTQSFTKHDINVFGVVSTAPGLMLNSQAGNDITHPYIALSGRVPVKAIGIVNKGDRVVTSNIEGHVEKLDPAAGTPDWRIVLGRAVTDKNTAAAGTVEIVVGVK